MFSWRCFPLVESAPRAYRLKASNAAPASSTSTGTFPRVVQFEYYLRVSGCTSAEDGGSTGSGLTKHSEHDEFLIANVGSIMIQISGPEPRISRHELTDHE